MHGLGHGCRAGSEQCCGRGSVLHLPLLPLCEAASLEEPVCTSSSHTIHAEMTSGSNLSFIPFIHLCVRYIGLDVTTTSNAYMHPPSSLHPPSNNPNPPVSHLLANGITVHTAGQGRHLKFLFKISFPTPHMPLVCNSNQCYLPSNELLNFSSSPTSKAPILPQFSRCPWAPMSSLRSTFSSLLPRRLFQGAA